jgi:small subunit ribosomal protein S21
MAFRPIFVVCKTFDFIFKEKILVGIIVQENEPIDRAIKRFKKKYERSGVLKEFKKRTFFTKPSIKKRMKRQKAIRRAKRSAEEVE